MERQPSRRHRGHRTAAVVLLICAVWFARGALITPDQRPLLAVLALASAAAAVLLWRANRWMVPAGAQEKAGWTEFLKEPAVIVAGLLFLGLLVVVAIVFSGGQIWR